MADFTVTSCTVSRSVMTPEDTVDITLTAKNNFGSKLTKFGLNLCFTNADRGLSGNGYWVPVVQAETSISWANGASKTATWSITPDTIMSQPLYASIYSSLKTRLSSVRTLPFRLEIVGTSSDGSFASTVYTVSGLTYIDKYYNPQITLDAWRYPNDEATALAATMKVELADGNNASNFTATMYYARDAKATTSSSVLSMNVSRDVLFGVGYSANTSVLPGTYANGSVYSFLLVVTDGIETASATCVVDRAFANLHLSGQSTGGVAIGKFSAATYGNPLFECEFPAVFGGGINKGVVEIVDITTINSNFKVYRTGEYPRLIRFGNVVFLEGCLSPSKSLTMTSTSNQYTMITIPAGYRPSRELIFVCHGSTLCLWLLRINTSGECVFERYRKGDAYATPASGNWLPFSAVWVLPE